jgi:N-acetylmuramoyl-L-alanine amidase
MGKRGQTELPTVLPIAIFGLLLVVGFFYLQTLKEIYDIQDETGYEVTFLVNDIPTVINVLYGVPSNMIVVYDKNMKWFSLDFAKDTVRLFDETVNASLRATKRLTPDTHTVLNERSLTPTFSGEKRRDTLISGIQPVFARIGDGILISDMSATVDYSLHYLSCKSDRVGRFSDIVVDAAHSKQFPGYVVGKRKEFELASRLGESVALQLDTPDDVTVYYTRDTDGNRKPDSAIEQVIRNGKTDLVLSLHAGKGKGNVVKFYYLQNAEESIATLSKSLGCRIANTLLSFPDLGIEGVSLIPLDASQRIGGEVDSYTGVLDPTIPGLLLEFGDLEEDRSYALFENPSTLSMIVEGVRKGVVG